jgi:single-strand DNA-binding protein
MNIAVLRGPLSSDPVERLLPSGSRLVNYEITTADPAGGAADTAPVAWFDPPARLPSVAKGDEIVVVGKVRRRFFRTAAGTTGSRTEVVAERVVPGRSAARAERLLTDAATRVDRGAG